MFKVAVGVAKSPAKGLEGPPVHYKSPSARFAIGQKCSPSPVLQVSTIAPSDDIAIMYIVDPYNAQCKQATHHIAQSRTAEHCCA